MRRSVIIHPYFGLHLVTALIINKHPGKEVSGEGEEMFSYILNYSLTVPLQSSLHATADSVGRRRRMEIH